MDLGSKLDQILDYTEESHKLYRNTQYVPYDNVRHLMDYLLETSTNSSPILYLSICFNCDILFLFEINFLSSRNSYRINEKKDRCERSISTKETISWIAFGQIMDQWGQIMDHHGHCSSSVYGTLVD